MFNPALFVCVCVCSAFVTPQLGLFLTKQLMLSGRKTGAEEAARLGFISSLVDTVDQLDTQTRSLIAELAENGPQVRSNNQNITLYFYKYK